MKLLYLLCLLLLSTVAFPQEAIKPRPSPLAVATARYKDTYLKITYSQPHKNGREIFGKLVPYNQVWRTGANEATEVTVTRDIKINEIELKSGSYSLFSIPGEEKWTIIFNSDLGQWGSYNYNSKMDAIRFDVPVSTLKDVIFEPFTIWIEQKNDKAEIQLAWDRTKVTLPVQFLEPKL